jgi:hypothetical protein
MPDSDATPLDFCALSGLERIVLIRDIPSHIAPPLTTSERTAVPLIVGNRSLRYLDVPGDLMLHIPFRSFAGLIHISIGGRCAGLDLVLQHSPCLRSLELHRPGFATIETLKDIAAQLRSLTSFSLCVVMDFPDESMIEQSLSDLHKFLKQLPPLLKLRLELLNYATDEIEPLLRGLPYICRHLTTFGLSFDMIDGKPTFASIARILPRSLVALSLNIPWKAHSLDVTSFLPLVSCMSLKFE